MSETKDPLEQLLELAVFAPVGLVLLVRDELPALVERGRGEVVGRVRVARFIGQFALAKARQEIDKRFASTTPAATPRPAPSATPTPTAAGEAIVVHIHDDAAPASPVVAAPSGDAGTLAIDGYDALAASQVVPRLGGLAATDLEAVRRYESAHRNRRTVLTRISQLQAGA